jgi:hypothetical protein
MVWVVRDDQVERRAVTVDQVNDDKVVVIAGVNGGDRVVVEGFDNLAEGMRVTEAVR